MIEALMQALWFGVLFAFAIAALVFVVVAAIAGFVYWYMRDEDDD